jgi:hypothetical protein
MDMRVRGNAAVLQMLQMLQMLRADGVHFLRVNGDRREERR